MHHLKGALHSHRLRHKKSEAEVKPEQGAEEIKEHLRNEFEAKDEAQPGGLPGSHLGSPNRIAIFNQRIDIAASQSKRPKRSPNVAKDEGHSPHPVAAQDARMRIVTAGKPIAQASLSAHGPTSNDIIRYRYHHGANLGSTYVLEKWLFPSAFPPSTSGDQTSELACVSLWIKQIGIEATRQKFENHWAKAMSDDDWQWLCSTGRCTSIRLPIGYFTLGQAYCVGTPFEPYGAVYANAWTAVKSFINKASGYGIGVLVDLHALPGGANPCEHSGTNLKVANLWDSSTNLDLATRCQEFIAREVSGIDNIIGIQLCNEAMANSDGMYNWYDQVLATVSAIDPTIPLYISDAWDLSKAVNYIKSRNQVRTYSTRQNPLVIDTHVYFCFDDNDKRCSPTQIFEKVPRTLSRFNGETGSVINTGATGVIVGEYACTLDPATWSLLPTGQDQRSVKKQFGNIQCAHFSSKAGGAFYWTLKMDWMDGDDWGFVAQTKSGAICPPSWLSFSCDEANERAQNADSKWSDLRDAAYKAHVGYWTRTAPNGNFQLELYKQGWQVGWNDARAFLSCQSDGSVRIMGASKIGLKDLWVLKRITDFSVSGNCAWEFEHGMFKGMADFETVALH